jgi:hypothetical protein
MDQDMIERQIARIKLFEILMEVTDLPEFQTKNMAQVEYKMPIQAKMLINPEKY